MNASHRMLVSLRRPWRAVPELDGLSDAEGRALVTGLMGPRRSWREALLPMTLVLLGSAFFSMTARGGVRPEVGLVVLLLVFMCGYALAWRRGTAAVGRLAVIVAAVGIIMIAPLTRNAAEGGRLPFSAAELIIAIIVVTVPSLAVAVLAQRIFDAAAVHRRVQSRLREEWCQGCAYPIYDLPVTDEPLECPRCRRPCIARAVIRTAAQVLACDLAAHAARARRPVLKACMCGYPLLGLPVAGGAGGGAAGGAVRCPECGAVYEAQRGGFVRTLEA